jgi:adenine phosphoribosyltransferase
LVEKQGATVSQFSFLIGLKDLKGDEKLKNLMQKYHILEYYNQ